MDFPQRLDLGWTRVFSLLSSVSSDVHVPLVAYAFELVALILRSRRVISKANGACLDAAISCLLSFAAQRNHSLTGMCSQAIDLLTQTCARALGSPVLETSDAADQAEAKGAACTSASSWFSLMTGLSRIILNEELEFVVRDSALNGFFSLMQQFGSSFDASTWSLFFKGVVFPLFDDVKYIGTVFSCLHSHDYTIYR